MSFVVEGFTETPEISTDHGGVTKTLTLQRHPRPLFQPGDALDLDQVEVFVGVGWGTWLKTDLVPQWVIWSTAESGIGKAELLNRYGERFQSGDAGDEISETEGNQFSWHPNVFYHLQFVKIVIGGGGETKVGEVEVKPAPLGSLFKRVWVGQIDAQGAALGGASTKHPTGKEVLHATSIEQAIFGRHFITTSEYLEFNHGGMSPNHEKTCRHGMTFNEEGVPNQMGRAIYNSAGELTSSFGFGLFMTRPDRGYPVSSGNVKTQPIFWSTRDIVTYILTYERSKTNSLADAEGSHINIAKFGDQESLESLPTWDRPVVETHGHRPIEILRRVLSRRRLLVWWLELDEESLDAFGNPTLNFFVRTTTVSPVLASGGLSIPANAKWLTVDADADPGANVQIDHNDHSLVHQVIVQGARRRNVTTLGFETPDTTLANDAPPLDDPNPEPTHRGDKYWTDERQAEYEAAASETDEYKTFLATDRDEKKRLNDLERSRDRYADVFTRFGMTYQSGRIDYPVPPLTIDEAPAWSNGIVYLVGDILKEGSTLIEVLTATGEADTNATTPDDDTEHTYEVFYENCFGNIHLLQNLALLEGRDYSGTNIADGTTATKEEVPRELDMFVLFWSEAKVKPGSDKTEGRYIPASKTSQLGLNPPKEGEDRDWSATVRVVDGDASFHIKVSGKDTRQHSIAKGTFQALMDMGYQEWEVDRFYTIGTIVKSAEQAQHGEDTYHEVIGGQGPSAGNGKALDEGSDTGYSYGPAMEQPTAMGVDDEEIGKVDWRQMQATICYQDDRFCESVIPAKPGGVGDDTLRVMRIDAGKSYRLDYVDGGTVVDINEKGEAVTSGGGYIRDDRLLLEEIARRAFSFYSRLRGVLRMSTIYRDTSSELMLGKMIFRVRNGSIDLAADDPNSESDFVPEYRAVEGVISELRVDFPYTESSSPAASVGPIRLSFQTTFGELDPKFFIRGA